MDGGWFLALAGLLIAAVLFPLRAARRWSGRWRRVALLPLLLLLGVLLRAAIVLPGARAPLAQLTLELLLACVGAILVTSLLELLHALVQAARGE
jgi:hypothetical protein